MRKTIVVLVIVVALVTLTAWANRKWPADDAQAAQQQIAPADSAPIGSDDAALQTLQLVDVNGKPVTLSDYRGKVVLVDFWATWCEPCKIETPWLIDFQQKYGSRGFVILGVAMDEEGAKIVAPYVASTQFDVNGQKETMNYRILLGTDDIADKFGGVEGYPTGMLFTRDGRKVKTLIGLEDYDEMDKDIQSLL
ncbi:MAG: TlpA disulfide reductase family protein [Candidatus Acidiferrales bacterium]